MSNSPFIDRIHYFRNKRGWSNYRLAKECNIPYSTLQTMYKTTYTPTISTIQKICSGLGITLSQFFSDDFPEDLTNEQQLLINKYNSLSESNKGKLLAYLDGLCDQG